MEKILLHDGWRMRQLPERLWLEAQVPGSVYNDLLRNGVMDDPYYRDNELKALAVIDNDFEYETEFAVPDNIAAQDEIFLVFRGLDTSADVYLNGKHLGYAENMHRTWEYGVKNLLEEENILRVVLHSPTRLAAESYEKDPMGGSEDAMRGFPNVRKAHCMYGWDWGPRLPDAGIWRAVSLEGRSIARFTDVFITQKHEAGRVELKVKAESIPVGNAAEPCTVRLTVTDPQGNVSEYGDNVLTVNISEPQLWWPNGFGEQPLYTVKAELAAGDIVVDVWENRIGLRTMEIHREKDEYGESFAHKVNGVKIFAMGADYIPEDNILSRVSSERTRKLLTDAKAAHFNCIRVWGGGYYPEDFFYDICDELGLIVWQDFMFACAVYHLTEEFEANIRAEFADNIRRLRHHASLGLWCGNNEMEMFMKSQAWPCEPARVSDYVKMYEYIIPQMLKEYDPNTFYWPASPSSGGGFDDPNDENRGDVHYWDVWHGNKPVTEYRKFFFRYVSEFGFQSFPSLKTCETFTEPEDRNIFSYVMEKHQRNAAANGKIMNYMEQTFLYPCSFDIVLYASQLLQAEAIRYGVEHFRRNRGRCMGTIVWQLNDCWPVASWSSIDYCGRWKALHYYEKRFFAPVMLSCEEESLLSQDPNPNAQPYDVRKSVRFNVANETMEPVKVTVKWYLRNSRSEVLEAHEEEVSAEALSAQWTERVMLPQAELRENYVSYECIKDGECCSAGTVLFCAPKQFCFRDPKLSVRAEGDWLIIRAEAFAKSVEVINEADDMLLEDNYFDMNAGEKRVRILKGKPEGLKIRSVFDIR